MNERTLSKWIAAAFMVIVLGGAMFLDQSWRGHMGKQVFLEMQAKRYDSYFAQPSLAIDLAVGLVFAGLFVLIYEVLAHGALLFLVRLHRRPPEH